MDEGAGTFPSRERQWSMSEVPLRDRFAAWCDILGATHLAFAMDPSPQWHEGFSADIREHGLGSLSLLETSVEPHRGRRTRRQVNANTRDVIGLHFINSGRQAVDLQGRRVILGPGDAMIWDGSATGGYEILEPLKKTTLIVPRAVAATVLPSYRNSFVQPLPGDHPPTRFLIRMLSLLCEQLPLMDDGARQASAHLIAELLKPLGELHGDNSAQPLRVSRPALRERVLDYIGQNLADPALVPTAIAAAHGVSVRTLYSAVEGLGVSLARYIRDQRLARCYDALLFGADPIGTIALKNGFKSAAHFSTAFRERYGSTPREVRRRG
ncbi:helix-turn-helix domain-containing protein [Streptomyces sp. NPDC088196]|uniref:helix-turn-helix domain-containing protein n=1 Tax=Streptomyces sp. NPDC088196 TaxID=3154868 RepID=UPI00344D0F89